MVILLGKRRKKSLFLFHRSVKKFFTDKSKLQEQLLGENGRTLYWNDKIYEPYVFAP